jgi:hypothetical protein
VSPYLQTPRKSSSDTEGYSGKMLLKSESFRLGDSVTVLNFSAILVVSFCPIRALASWYDIEGWMLFALPMIFTVLHSKLLCGYLNE